MAWAVQEEVLIVLNPRLVEAHGTRAFKTVFSGISWSKMGYNSFINHCFKIFLETISYMIQKVTLFLPNYLLKTLANIIISVLS